VGLLFFSKPEFLGVNEDGPYGKAPRDLTTPTPGLSGHTRSWS
jgi:hypothetical protein